MGTETKLKTKMKTEQQNEGKRKDQLLINLEFYVPLGARLVGLSRSETASSLWKPQLIKRETIQWRHFISRSEVQNVALSSMKERDPSCFVWAVLMLVWQCSCHSQPQKNDADDLPPFVATLNYLCHKISWVCSNPLQHHQTSTRPVTFAAMLPCQHGLKFPTTLSNTLLNLCNSTTK